MRVLRRPSILGLAALALALGAASAPAAVTIGQLAPGTPGSICVNPNPFDVLQPTVTSGTSFVVPSTVADGRITSWRHNAGPGAGQTLGLKTFRAHSTNPAIFRAIAHEGPRPIAPSTLNTFSGVSVPVKAGDILGLHEPMGATGACVFPVPGESWRERQGNLADGESGTFNAQPDHRLNISATIEPTNTFTLGSLTRNKKKGTATQQLTVPNPGQVAVSGNGVKPAAGASAAVAVTLGTVSVTIRAQGKKKKKLRRKGKVSVSPTITYTPTGGTATIQTTQLKLRKKRKKKR